MSPRCGELTTFLAQEQRRLEQMAHDMAGGRCTARQCAETAAMMDRVATELRDYAATSAVDAPAGTGGGAEGGLRCAEPGPAVLWELSALLTRTAVAFDVSAQRREHRPGRARGAILGRDAARLRLEALARAGPYESEPIRWPTADPDAGAGGKAPGSRLMEHTGPAERTVPSIPRAHPVPSEGVEDPVLALLRRVLAGLHRL